MHLLRTIVIAFLVLLGLLRAPGAFGQSDPRVNLRIDDDLAAFRDDGLPPVEQGVADVGTLSTSLRLLSPGLDRPSGFSQVYPVPGRPGWFMRVDGGLYAVFRQSVYGAQGALIPNDTVFYIGEPEFHDNSGPSAAGAARAEAAQDSPKRLDSRRPGVQVDSRARVASSGSGVAPVAPALEDHMNVSIAVEGPYRQDRLMSLMRHAARVAAQRHQFSADDAGG